MKKIRLTEGQFDMVQRISEADDTFDWYFTEMEKLNQAMNAIYKRLTFSTLAEIIDGDIDISVLNQKIEQIADAADKLKIKVDAQAKRVPQEEWEANYQDLDLKLDNIHHAVALHKRGALEHMVEVIESILRRSETKAPLGQLFSDIKTIDLQ